VYICAGALEFFAQMRKFIIVGQKVVESRADDVH